jgi:hypothetical protein
MAILSNALSFSDFGLPRHGQGTKSKGAVKPPPF